MTIEKELYDHLYQSNVLGKENSKKVFRVPTGNVKNTEMHALDPHAP